MRIKLNISNLYFTIAMLYLLQDVIYEGGGIYSKIIVGVFLLSSMLIAAYINIRIKLPSFFKGLNILLALFTIYGIIHTIMSSTDYVWCISQEAPTYYYLFSIYTSLLPIYVFYVCTIKGEISQAKIQLWTIIIIGVSIAKFILHYLNSIDYVGDDEITNNYGYLFVGIIPLLLFFNNKSILQYVLLMICMVFVMLSMKRGAILIASCCLAPFAISLWKQSKSTGRIIVSLLIVGFLIGSLYFIQHFLLTSDYFLARIEATKEGNSSLRDELYSTLWNYFINDASFLKQLIGGGANYTLQIAVNYAHNDWLEILINQGIIGVFIYMIYWIYFGKSLKSCSNIPILHTAHYGIIICFIISFLSTFFSMSYNSLPLGLTMALGICLGQISQFQSQDTTLVT